MEAASEPRVRLGRGMAARPGPFRVSPRERHEKGSALGNRRELDMLCVSDGWVLVWARRKMRYGPAQPKPRWHPAVVGRGSHLRRCGERRQMVNGDLTPIPPTRSYRSGGASGGGHGSLKSTPATGNLLGVWGSAIFDSPSSGGRPATS